MRTRKSPNKKTIIPDNKELDVFTPSEEALICLNCPYPKCKPSTCKRLREERKKLKGQKNDRV